MNNLIHVAVIILFIASANGIQSKSLIHTNEYPDEFAKVDEDTKIVFPRDHGDHPKFRTEWWYITANVEDTKGNPFGIQWTLFRSALSPEESNDGWESNQMWMGHSAVTTSTFHFFSEKFARGGVGQAGVNISPFKAWIDDWSFTGDWKDGSLKASGDFFSYDLTFSSRKPIVLHGRNGVSQKSFEGTKSYYYSQPFFKIKGTVEINGKTHEVSGNAWADREWSSQIISDSQIGWNWLGLHLDDESKIMIFEVKGDNTGSFFSGTRIYPDGSSKALKAEDFTLRPINSSDFGNKNVQLHWEIIVPSEKIAIIISPINPNAYMETSIPYWEGPVIFQGSHSGTGYLEITM